MRHCFIPNVKAIALTAILIISFAISSSAQAPSINWIASTTDANSTNDGAVGHAVAYDALGNVYSAGTFWGPVDFDPSPNDATQTPSGNTNGYLVKYNANGAFQWVVKLSGSLEAACLGVAVDGSNNVYVTGMFSGTANFNPSGSANLTSVGATGLDAFVAKYNANGIYQWAFQIGNNYGDQGYALTADVAGNVYVCGHFYNTVDFNPSSGTANLVSAGGYDAFVAKYSTSGAYQWAVKMGGAATDVAESVSVDGSGNVYVSGQIFGTANFNPAGSANLTPVGAGDAYLAKYNASGAYQWVFNVGGTGNDLGFAVIANASSVYLSGVFNNTANFNPAGSATLTSYGSDDIFLAKYDAAGAYQWAVKMGGTNQNRAYDLALDGSGNVYVAGATSGTANFNGAGSANYTSAGNYDAYLVKYSSAGSYQWHLGMGGAGDDRANEVAVSSTGKVLISGRYVGPATFGSVTLSEPGVNSYTASFNGGSAPLTVTLNTTNPTCPLTPNGNITVMASGGNTPYSYAWSNGQTSATSSNLGAGMYSVTVTDATSQSATASATLAYPACGTPSGLTVSSIANTSATVSFTGNSCAVKYRLQFRNYYTGLLSTVYVSAPTTSYNFSALTANTPYEIKVQTYCTSTGSSVSSWTSPVYFITTGPNTPQCVPPTNISVTALSNTSLKVSWTPVASSVGYQVQYRKAGTTTWTIGTSAYGATSNRTLAGLTPNTPYEIRLRTRCTQSPATYSVYSTIVMYSTPLRLDAQTGGAESIALYPNPTSGNLTINFPDTWLQPSFIVVDMMGRVVLHHVAHSCCTARLSLAELISGYYFVQFIDGEVPMVVKPIVLER